MTTDHDSLVRAVADAELALADLSEVGGDSAVVEGIACSRLPVDYPWAVKARAMTPPTPSALAAALAWMASRSAAGGMVMTRGVHATHPVFTDAGLTPGLVLPALVRLEAAEDIPAVAGLEIGPARSAAEFRTVFASFGTDLAAMVTDAHLAAPSYRYVVARFGGAPVGCAQISFVAGTTHLSAVAVLPEFRGLGVGTAISAGATLDAAARTDGPVWLHAEPHLHALYGRLGYRLVDEHVQLSLV